MKEFDSAYEAIRKVKSLVKDMDSLYDKIYFVFNDYYEKFFVTDDSDELSELIYKKWNDSGCDNNPEDEAKYYKIWEYSLAENKKKYPHSYAIVEDSLISCGLPLIRKRKRIDCEYSVDFNVM